MFHCCSFVSFVEAAQWVGKSFVPFGENSWKCTIHYQWKWSQQLSAVVSFPSWQDGASGDTFVNARPLYALEVDSHGCLPPPPHPTPTSPPLSPLSISTPPLTPFLSLPAFLPSQGWQTLVISRYSGPGGSGFPLARRLCSMRIFMA